MDLIQQLQSEDCATVPRFSFKGIKTYARVANVHDPDTITVIFKFINQMIKVNLRVGGVDAPELHSPKQAEVDACMKGIKALNELIADKVIKITLGKFDKYGRILAELNTLDPIDDTGLTNIGGYLIRYRYARIYNGGKKVEWTDNELLAAGTVSNQSQQPKDPATRDKPRKQRKRITV